MFSPLGDIFNLSVARVTWISQRVAVELSVIIEQASSSEALIWKMNTLRLSCRPCGNFHMALDTMEQQSMRIRTYYCSWTNDLVKYNFKIIGNRAIDVSISCSVMRKQDISFDKKKETSSWKVAGFTGRVRRLKNPAQCTLSHVWEENK